MEKIGFPPYNGTYIQILPKELRILLYQYAKHYDMKYNITNIAYSPDLIRFQLVLNGVKTIMMIDSNMVSIDKIRAFIRSLVLTTQEGTRALGDDEGILNINSVNLLAIMFTTLGEEIWLQSSDQERFREIASSYTVFPICIELMEALEALTKFLKG